MDRFTQAYVDSQTLLVVGRHLCDGRTHTFIYGWVHSRLCGHGHFLSVDICVMEERPHLSMDGFTQGDVDTDITCR